MSLAVISDIHGNYPALISVLRKIDQIGCDQIISLGDVAGFYCMVNECISELRNRNIVSIMGNHDYYLLGKGQCPRSFTVNKCIEYQKGIITEENFKYLSQSVDKLDTELVSARHGGWIDPLDEYIDTFDFNHIQSNKIRLYCSGHTHIQKIEQHGDIVYFNPGSVGQPRDGDPRASFAIVEDDGKVRMIRVMYNIDEIVEIMRSLGFEERISSCLYEGVKIKSGSIQ